MTRKLLSSLLLLLALSCALATQKIGCKIMQEPKAPPAGTCSFSIYGISPNGRYIYKGSPNSTAFCYDTQRDTTSLLLSKTGAEKYVIYAISDDDEILVAQNEVGAFVYNMAQEKLHEIKTPENDWSDVRPIYVTPDAKHLASYVINPAYAQESMAMPIYGTRSENGSWTIKELPVLGKGYLSDKPNYTQAFFCSSDGEKISGRQNTHNETDRPLFWQLGDQEQYQYSTSCSSFLYNLEAPLPDPQPEWDDYVTADYEAGPNTYAQQGVKCNEAYTVWEKTYNRVVKRTVPDLVWQIMSLASDYWMVSIREVVGEGDNMVTIAYPGSLGMADGSISRPNIKEAYGLGGVGRTSNGEWICYPDGSLDPSDRNTYVLYSDDKKMTMLEYLKQITGTDPSPAFTYFYTPYDKTEQKSTIDMGTIVPFADGKTLTSYAVDMTGARYYRSAYLRVDKHFLVQPLAIAPIEIEHSNLSVLWQDGALHFSEPATGTLYLYNTTGRLLESYRLLDGSKPFLTELTQGLYANQLVTERGVSTVRFAR